MTQQVTVEAIIDLVRHKNRDTDAFSISREDCVKLINGYAVAEAAQARVEGIETAHERAMAVLDSINVRRSRPPQEIE